MTLPIALALAYLAGAIPTSWIAARLGAGIDLREQGSGNLGATNLYRVLGWRYALPVGLFDVAKGAVPVLVLSPVAGSAPWIPLAVGVAAILGHVFSVFVRFRGGKGVATAAGVVLALAPLPLLVSAAVWVTALKTSGYVSLASLAGAVTFPLAVWVLGSSNRYVLPTGAALAAFIVLTHRANIRRLFAGTENRFGRKARGPA
jgi:acyl phosphate:glycerol-3-phosphate acyltransferase